MFETGETDPVMEGRTGLPKVLKEVPQQPAALRLGARSPETDLRGPRAKMRHARLMSFYTAELDRQFDNRMQQAKDFDYYDNEQWDEDDAEVLRDRGQKPLVFNVISTTIDWITGSEKRARTDFKVLPRKKEGGKAAELKTDAMKYHADACKLEFHRSRAFEEAVKGGIGWMEDQWQDDGDGEPVYSRFESWRNMLWDSTATEMDLQDGRYEIRSKWVDLDIALSWFPKMRTELELSAESQVAAGGTGVDNYGDEAMDSQEEASMGNTTTPHEFDYLRRRVRLIEMWYRVPAQVQKVKGGQFNGEIFDPMSRGHYDDLSTGNAVVVSKSDMQMRCAIMTPDHLLFDALSPYRHGKFPFTPIWGYRRNKSGLPYGVIRRVRDIQDDVNWRAAKARHILASNKVVMEEGAVEDLEEFEDEVNRPNAIIVKRRGAELDLNVERGMDIGHTNLMTQSIQMIQQAGGVTDENLGRRTNATSGIAIGRRQEQGALATAGLFDNLLYANQTEGEKILSLIEQFWTDEKEFRISNKRGVPAWRVVNVRDPRTGRYADDITNTKSDYVISQDEWRASVREAQTDKLIEMLKTVAPNSPEVWMVVLDLIVDGMDIANKDEIVERIRGVTGAKDPDAVEQTPEQAALEAKKQAAEDRAVRMEEATIAEREASAAQKRAAAGSAEATAKNIIASMAGSNVAAMQAALETALAMIAAPDAVPIADTVAREAGLVSRSEHEDNAQVSEQADALEQAAAEGAVMQQDAQAAAEQEAAEAEPPHPADSAPPPAAAQIAPKPNPAP